MKKETLIAIILGVVAGLGVAVVMIEKAREHQMTSTQAISTSLQLTPKVTVNNSQLQPLELSKPDDGSISNVKTVELKGKAGVGALIVVQSPLKTIVQKLDKADIDIKNFPLALGENTIRVSAYPKDSQGSPQEKELKIYYLDQQ
jgi:mannitol-specific phosphotransferase system IIBC component